MTLAQILAEASQGVSFGNNSLTVTPKINGMPFSFTVPVTTNTENQVVSYFQAASLLVALIEAAHAHPATQPKT